MIPIVIFVFLYLAVGYQKVLSRHRIRLKKRNGGALSLSKDTDLRKSSR